MATQAPHAIVIEPETFPPDAQQLLEELAERLPEAYARVFIAAATASNATVAPGVLSRLARVLDVETGHLEEAARTIDTAIRNIQAEINKIGAS